MRRTLLGCETAGALFRALSQQPSSLNRRPSTLLPPHATEMTDASAAVAAVSKTVEKHLKLVPSSFCDASNKFNNFVEDLTWNLGRADDKMERLTKHYISGNLAAATLIGVGGALVMAPIIFGREWLKPVLTLLALLLGAIGTGMLLNDQGLGLFDTLTDMASIPSGEVSCGALLGLQVLGAILLAVFINTIPALAFFAIGAAGAGFAAYVGSGVIISAAANLPFLDSAASRAISRVSDDTVLIGVAALAILGGLLFGAYKDHLIDLTLGLLGAALLAQGLMQVLTMDVLSREQKAQYKVDELYMFYVVGLAALIEALRYLFISVRMGDFASAASQIDATPGASLVARAKATAAKVAPKAGSPAKGKMAANSKKTPAMH